MNKLIFNEGGQPVYIEDLKLLQDNNTLITKAMMGVVLQREEACLMQPCEVVTVGINTPDLSANIEVPAGEIYYNGMILPFEGKKLTIAKGAPLYICLKRTLTDLRTFENGQQHHCQEAWSASVETQNVGADKAIALSDLKTYLQLLEQALLNSQKREAIPCVYANDYSGDLTAKMQGDDIEFSITVPFDGFAPASISVQDTSTQAVSEILYNMATKSFVAKSTSGTYHSSWRVPETDGRQRDLYIDGMNTLTKKLYVWNNEIYSVRSTMGLVLMIGKNLTTVDGADDARGVSQNALKNKFAQYYTKVEADGKYATQVNYNALAERVTKLEGLLKLA